MKNKKSTMLTGVMLAFIIFICAALSACNNNTDSEGVIHVYVQTSGYGTAFVDKLGKAYEQKTGIKVEKHEVTGISDIITKFESGTTNADLFISRAPIYKYVYNSIRIGGTTYPCLLEDLTDIYTSELPGEDITVEGKMYDSYLARHAIEKDGVVKYYSMPWISGLNGILINEKTWKPEWNEPRTTDELLMLCDTISQSGQTPFIYSLADSYWNSGIAPVWAAQYEGPDNVALFQAGKDAAGNRYVPEMMLYNGFLEAIKVMEKLLDDSKGYMHASSKSLDFTSVQNIFLSGKQTDGSIVMMPTGDWIECEMAENYAPGEVNVHFMRMPVISALGNKLGITDAQLCALIDYVDGKTADPPAFTSSNGKTNAEVIAAVSYARKLLPSYSVKFAAFVPIYANEKNSAKDFLKFMASDEGIELFVEESGGYTLPYKYDYLNSAATRDRMSDFLKSCVSLILNSDMFEFSMKDRIFSLGYLQLPGMNVNNYYEAYLSAAKGSADYKTAEKIFIDDYNYVKSRWELIKTNAGIA